MSVIAANTILKGHWIIGHKLGEGACASVYAVLPTSTNTSPANISYVAKVIPLPKGKGKILKEQTILCNTLYCM